MSIRVLRPGLLTSVQDLGRFGFQKYGVIVGGGMDPLALRVANLLVGNDEKEAVLEITLVGPSLLIERDALLSLTGADLSAKIGEAPFPMWRPVYVKKGSVINFGSCKSGCRAYLAVAGGFALEPVLGSKSTYLRGGIGGYHGRALAAGDVLCVNNIPEKSRAMMERLQAEVKGADHAAAEWSVGREVRRFHERRGALRVIRGRHFSLFTENSQRDFFQHFFLITPQSDRMGYRLKGPALELKEPKEMISEAVSHGTIQVPPDGNPIVLLSDRQTIGGYPRIAQVVTVDFPVVAQLKPGDRIRFEEISLAEAEQLYVAREREMQELKTGIAFKMKPG